MLESIYMYTNLPILFLIMSLILEILNIAVLKQHKNYRINVSTVNVTFIMFSSTSFLMFAFNTFTVLLFIVGLFRIINVSRIFINKINQKELISRYTRTMFWLGFISVILVYLSYQQSTLDLIYFAVISLGFSIILFLNTVYSMFRWKTKKISESKLSNLPTVSICIPARNETQDLPECIETVLSSTYTKLEILVLDDCSHDKTPAIIKDYAHRGVRFISGQEPGIDWVAKNRAMDKLFDESRGEIVIFAGVDVRFKPESVYQIVEQLEYGLYDMISILPRRYGASEGSVFIQPLRYWWELSVPRLLGKRPPALSTIWAIRRKKLLELGSFESVKRSIRPEAHFAKRLSSAYKFILAGSNLGLTSVKGPREQFDTALRMRYPQTRRRPESVLAILSLEILIFIFPIIAVVQGLRVLNNTLFILGAINLLILVSINLYISFLCVKRTWYVGLISLPFLIAEEWYVLIRSMLAYEFGDVRWKERNICLPMLQVEKELPKI
jgi:glycosyltransferase involved in cell wall biosynthesis